MYYALFILLAAAVVFLSIKLAKYVDLLDKTTKISGAFIGAVLLAAVTSLPELFTSISATLIVRENELVLGNILGSNLFNFAVLGLALIVFIKRADTAKPNKSYILSLCAMLLIYALTALDVFLDVFPKIDWFSLSSPFILIIYILFLFFTPKTKEGDDDAHAEDFVSPLSLKQIIIRFTVCAVLLISASIAITYAADIVAEKLSLGKTFAGALLLGITTSLPETVSTLSLCRKRNYNAAFGNICGSNVFNCCIFAISDFLSFTKDSTDVYINNMSSTLLLIFGAAIGLLFVGFICLTLSEKERPVLTKTAAGALGILSIGAYIAFTVVSVVM